MRTVIISLLVFLFLSACTSEVKQYHNPMRAEFTASAADILKIKRLLQEVANSRGLRYTERDKDRMRVLAGGKEAFFIDLFYNEERILLITNVAYKDQIFLAATDTGKTIFSDIEGLQMEVKTSIETALDIQFESDQ